MEIWVVCEKGHVHWGSAGAGILFRFTPEKGEAGYLLQRRGSSVDYAGLWGIPGGAMRDSESPEVTARREAEEEIGTLPPYRLTSIHVEDCGGGWKFHVVVADVAEPFPALCGKETEAIGWFTMRDIEGLSLHPGFRVWFQSYTAAWTIPSPTRSSPFSE